MACNQNWLNISMDDCHSDYTRKWTQKKVENIPFLSVNSKKMLRNLKNLPNFQTHKIEEKKKKKKKKKKTLVSV